MPPPRTRPSRPAILLALAVAGCSQNPLSLADMTASLGGQGATAATAVSADAPVDVYARIARGALKCWFGVEGSLKRSHVFHARVDPPSAGGGAEIVVHTRDSDQGSPGKGSLRAYVVTIAPAATGSLIEASNIRFPEADAAIMTADVTRWVSNAEGCSGVGTGGWTPAQAATAQKSAAPSEPAAKPAKPAP